jgi:hypothetical protein
VLTNKRGCGNIYSQGTPYIDEEATEMKKISNKEILIGAVAYKLNCSEECLKGYTKEQLKKMLED